MTTTTVHPPSPVAEPRGAPIAAWLAAQLVLAFRLITAHLAAKPRNRTREAAKLRAYARQMRDDPQFAADLMAAADRHEREE